MDNKNYYEILNIPKNASKAEIKKAYKKLVKKYHPDLYKGNKNFAEQKIKEINEAYDVLSNVEKKLEYDNSLNNSISYNNPVTNYKQEDKNQSNLVTNFIFEKIEHLNRKHQILIFIIILFITLSLFLSNLLGLRNYLIRNSKENIMNSDNTLPSTYPNDYPNDNYFEHREKHSTPYNYNSEIYNSIDQYLYEYFQSYFY